MGPTTLAEFVVEAQQEVTAANRNLSEAINAWETMLAELNPTSRLIKAAHLRIIRAEALLRSAKANMKTDANP